MRGSRLAISPLTYPFATLQHSQHAMPPVVALLARGQLTPRVDPVILLRSGSLPLKLRRHGSRVWPTLLGSVAGTRTRIQKTQMSSTAPLSIRKAKIA